MTDHNAERDHDQRRSERRKKSLSMHEGIAVWCDCCSCEAEERWVEVGKEMGIEMDDYEKEEGEEKKGSD